MTDAHLPPPVPEPLTGDLLQTRCAGCGSQVAFAPGSSALQCAACGHRTEIVHDDHESVDEHSFDAWAAANPKHTVASLGGMVLTCQGCRAVTESTALSGTCQFCSGNLVAVSSPEGMIEPEAVVPFAIEQAAAREAFASWVRSRWFAPNALKAVGDTESLQGTYVPHWTFDADTRSDYTGERGERYTVEVNGETQRKVRWHPARGTVTRSFDDVVVPASTSVPPKTLDTLGPWELGKAVPYRPEYLAGHSTLRYDVDPPAGLATAKKAMAPVIRKDVERSIGGDEQKIARVQTAYAAVMFKLVLLPIWIATYMYAGKQWQVMVNANTGEVTGQRPFSAGKIAIAIVAAIIVVVLVVYFWLMRR
ncbi:hypothetical protein GCM10011331_19920 [Flavimobilis marinus]|uniref:Replication restart DNA helicase PriA n=1 Tax=Flavimobilis marinus TaxID=285351 RepID=A0A1I2H427_9MICO|nr:hypothetical protein [Flavimobilis marinus]GHG54280.1 hypothetical protein GCM10011331_19920 [Flavimobilis marinus]SFF24432.1 hypothetical protein SAMN04488035_2180 [Flavimobilis marinus]